MTGASRVVVDVDGIAVSALLREARQPRAVVLALHGGAAFSGYFDYPDRPRMSLLRTGEALGFTVIAIDRPGYGSSAPYANEFTSAERRVDVAYGAVDRLLAARPRGAGVFVLAHSIGCELGVRMAADDRRGGDLLGLELAGTGRRHHDDAAGILGDWRHRPPNSGVRDLLWQPSRLYADDVVGGARISSRSPAYEGVDEQTGGGHNLSIGLTSMTYHLKVLSFVEECVLAREEQTSAAEVAERQQGRAS